MPVRPVLVDGTAAAADVLLGSYECANIRWKGRKSRKGMSLDVRLVKAMD